MGENIKEDDFLLESNRIATFKNWPNPNISPKSLAKAGFYYLNHSDQVKCAWCKGVMAKWEKQDNAFEEHKRYFPNCPRVQLGPNIEIANDAISDLGIQKISTPKKPKYSSLDARLRTYTSWPIPDIQRPESLAEAGLYYQNVDDQVRCFHCNMGLRSWQREDDPWFEHTKWFPQCQFVRLVKGANYVQQVLARQQGPQLSVLTINEAMMTTPVLQALEMGIDGGAIKNVTQRKLLATGCPYDSVESLIKDVFGDSDGKKAVATKFGVNNGNSDTSEVSALINVVDEAGLGESLENNMSITSSSFNTIFCEPINVNMTTGPVATNATVLKDNFQRSNIDYIKPNLFTAPTCADTMDLSENQCKSLTCNRSLSLEEENRKLKDARLCKVCLDDEVGVVFLPCGHFVTCVQCAPGVNLCPMCRTIIKGFVRTYLS